MTTTVIRKAAAAVEPGADDADTPHGSFSVVLSTGAKDRDGEEVKSTEWQLPLPGHITMDVDHGMTVASTAGSGVPSIDENGRLVVTGTYASTELGQTTRALVNEGHIRATSVAFIRKSGTDQKGARTVKRELLNGAFVPIPANVEALVLASKSGARNNKTDAENIQVIHDTATGLGAACSGAAKSLQLKSIAGSIEALRDRVVDALQDANPGAWVWPRGIVPDTSSGGYVVFELHSRDEMDVMSDDLLKQSFTDDGSAVTLTGAPAPVDLLEVVTPDPDAPNEPPADPAAPPAAPAAAKAAADAAQVTAIRSRIHQLATSLKGST